METNKNKHKQYKSKNVFDLRIKELKDPSAIANLQASIQKFITAVKQKHR
jgi:hypothetical protein